MDKQAGLILRDAVERILEHHDTSYVIMDTAEGFSVYFPNRSFVYLFSYQDDRGWRLDVLLKNVKDSGVSETIQQEQTLLSSLVKQYNIRYVLYKQKPKNHVLQQRKEIDAFFFRYQKLLKGRMVADGALRYTFHPIGELHPFVAVDYHKETACWVLSYSDFNAGEKVHPALEKLYCESQQLIFDLNKRNC